jgi:hypothetical protein
MGSAGASHLLLGALQQGNGPLGAWRGAQCGSAMTHC